VGRPLVVIGASAGGVETLRTLVRGLPADLAAPVLIVLHISPAATSVLPSILDRAGPLPATTPRDGERLHAGRIYIAPPDHHLTVRDDHAVLSRGPQENGHRPAIDPLFRSAVRAAGAAVVGVVLSGTLDDGAAGLAAIVRNGGKALVQEPSDALHPGMPLAALKAVPDATVANAEKLGSLIAALLSNDPGRGDAVDDPRMEREVAIAELDPEELTDPDRPGEPAGLGCPDCHGALFAVEEGEFTRFRCRVGHAWSPESLLERQNTALESALWMALRTMEDKAALHRRMADAAMNRGAENIANWNVRSAHDMAGSARLIRDLLAREPVLDQ
jgi:two-component system chemotaxis response regulator CheB